MEQSDGLREEEYDTSFEAQFERLMIVSWCGDSDGLAELLGLSVDDVVAARQRKDIPAEWLLTLLRKKSINPDWILTGEGHMLLPSEQPESVLLNTMEHCSMCECSTDDLVAELVRRALHRLG